MKTRRRIPNMDVKVRLCNSEMIESQLLIALSDDEKVACIFTCEDLTAIIDGLFALKNRTTKQTVIAHDLNQLRRTAFNVPLGVKK